VLDLEPFTLGLGQALVVGRLVNEGAYLGPEQGFHILRGGLRIFDSVTEHDRNKSG
jgi:hypothetical protein